MRPAPSPDGARFLAFLLILGGLGFLAAAYLVVPRQQRGTRLQERRDRLHQELSTLEIETAEFRRRRHALHHDDFYYEAVLRWADDLYGSGETRLEDFLRERSETLEEAESARALGVGRGGTAR